MPLIPIKIAPGIQKENPSLTSDPSWRNSDKIRFKAGQPEKIGGWVRDLTGLAAMKGIPRSIHTWRLNSGLITTAFGTSQKLYIWQDNTLYDITPIRETQNPLATDPFSTSSGSTTVTVTDTAHGSENMDYVTFSGAVCATLTDSEVNANHQITYVDGNTYTFEVTTAATGTDAADGGASVVGAYEIGIGANSETSAYGYGAGQYGNEEYGDARTAAAISISLRYWSLDNFGEDLVACHEEGGMYTWDATNGTATRAIVVTNAPSANELVMVTSPDRHLVSFGGETTGTQDKMVVVWADQETLTTWTATAENTAGSLILTNGSEIVNAEHVQNGNLIWTDRALYNMQYIGPPFTFSFNEIAGNCGAISKGCVIQQNNKIYWLNENDFFVYDGVVRVLPCSVHRYVFQDLKISQKSKVTCGLIQLFDEIIWFYPSDSSDENDRYVIYNYETNIWYTGNLERTAWLDVSYLNNPVATNSSGTIYIHESGTDDDTSAMTAYVESSDFDMDQGDKFFLVRRAIPDMTIAAGSVDYIFKTKRYPQSTQTTDTTSTVTSSTEKLDLRIRTRDLSLRVESDALSDDWQMGTPYLDLRPVGRR